MAKDPVCGMDVDPKPTTPQSYYQGTTYYFCCQGCKEEFDQNPAEFVKKA